MSRTIKVSVEYETPKTTKFEALMKEFEVAKKVADETVSYYKPLADCAEEAKFEAIMEQLETIKWYAQRISNITHESVFFRHWFGAWAFQIAYRPKETVFAFEVTYGGNPFVKDNPSIYNRGTNIVGNWEEWHCFEILEKDACEKLEGLIQKEKERGQKQIERLNNIQR
jgi:hypothetical protein